MNSDDKDQLYNFYGSYLPSSQRVTPLCIGESIGPVNFFNQVGDDRSTSFIDDPASLYHEASPSGMGRQQVVQSAGLSVGPVPGEYISTSLLNHEMHMDRLPNMPLPVPLLTNYSDKTFVLPVLPVHRDRAPVNSA
ncbi:hypothetical protein PM082_005111 [Marasmius tenuissimus]|nr:hypothetical protein PM082_005111 [Marasmius tenuissimus]